MTDFASLLVADRGRRPGRSTSSTRRASPTGSRSGRPRTARCSRRSGSTARPRFAFVILPRGGEFEVVGAVKNAPKLCRPGASPSSPKACPKAPTSWPTASPARRRSAGCSRQHRFDAYRSKTDEPERGPRVLLTGDAGKIERHGAAGRGDRARPRPGQHARRRSRPGRARAGRARRWRRELGAQVRVTSGDELAEGYPLIAAVGAAATDERAPRLIELEWGKPDASARRDRRQGRLLRQRRPRPQAGRAACG